VGGGKALRFEVSPLHSSLLVQKSRRSPSKNLSERTGKSSEAPSSKLRSKDASEWKEST